MIAGFLIGSRPLLEFKRTSNLVIANSVKGHKRNLNA